MIDKLTPEQEAAIEVYRLRGIKDGINTDPISDETIKEVVAEVYRMILEKEVPKIEIYDSPKAAWEAVLIAANVPEEEEVDYVHPYLDGHQMSYFFAYYDYMHDVLGVEYDCVEEYETLRGILKMGNVYPLDDICIVSRKPAEMHMNEEYKYHNENGPAIRYADGFSIYMLNGVHVPAWLVETPWEKMDARKFAEISNVEVRREFVRKMGVERMIQKLGARVLDKQGDYELVQVDLGGETGYWPYLKMKNPSIGVWHVEAVPREISSVKAALAWRNQSELEPEQLT